MAIDPRSATPPAVLNEVIRRIVEAADPDKVILSGSGASGDMTAGSDLDVLAIKTGAHRRQLAQIIYRGLYGLGQAVDVVVVRPEDIERYGDVAQALAGTALAGRKEGGPEHTVATTVAEQAALKKLVANWRALIDQRLAADEGTLFDIGRRE